MSKQSILLMLGKCNYGASISKFKLSGGVYLTRYLESSENNWRKILDIFDEYDVKWVVGKFTPRSIELFSNPDYTDLARELVMRISKVPSFFAAYEAILSGAKMIDPSAGKKTVEDIYSLDDFDDVSFDDICLTDRKDYFAPPPKECVDSLVDFFFSKNINILPYKTNNQLGVMISEFLDDAQGNLIFRFYIPNERMWADEAGRLIELFSDYLQNVSGLSVKHTQNKTSKGVVYEFFGGDSLAADEMPSRFDEFSSFMESCLSDPASAELIIKSHQSVSVDVIGIVQKYSRDARRLFVDMKHERERRVLALKQSFESELADHVSSVNEMSALVGLADAMVPEIKTLAGIIGADGSGAVFDHKNVVVNINPQFINKVKGCVAQTVFGNQNFGVDGEQLLQVIEQYGDNQAAQLKTALYELNDKGVAVEKRISAGQKLKGFVYKVADKLGDVAAGVLQSYIEGLSGLS
jgi:hypothetical protein